jgi:hypothetical protein
MFWGMAAKMLKNSSDEGYKKLRARITREELFTFSSA